MKSVKVLSEQWFKGAPFHEVKMVGIKHLGIPAEKFANKQPEAFKRALVRQTFVVKYEYGQEFEIIEAENPFGSPSKRKTPGTTANYEYSFVNNGLRAPEGDIRHEMMEIIERNTSVKAAIEDWETNHPPGEKYPNTGNGVFTFKDLINWSLLRGWIIKTGE
jgi:hypothetical protein